MWGLQDISSQLPIALGSKFSGAVTLVDILKTDEMLACLRLSNFLPV